MSSEPKQIDATIEVVTPENIAFNYHVAGPFRRLPAYLIDFAIRAVVWVGMLFGLSLMGVFGMSAAYLAIGVLLLAWFLMAWFYGALFETFMNGQTPGKWLLGVRVVTVEGQPINGMQAVLRNLIRTVDLLPGVMLFPNVLFFFPTGVLGLLTMTLNRRFQRLGDLVAGTMVIIEERTWLLGVARLDDPRAAQLAAYLPPKFEVSRSLALALAAYVERRAFFSPARRREIARHLGEPLLREFGLPADTSHDLLLCALYYKAFVAEHGDDSGPSPFAQVAPPPAKTPIYIPPPLPQEQMVTGASGGSDNPFVIHRR